MRDVRAREFVDAGERVVVGITPPDDGKGRFRFYQVLTLSDGRIVHIQDHAKRERALREARLA